MKDNLFFKPTQLYKEFFILDLIEKDKDITQREIATTLGIALSMVNNYLDEYEEKKYIKRKYHSAKIVEYLITKTGIERKKYLNISYFSASQSVYTSAKKNIVIFLNQIIEQGFKKILLYGAGEVAEILLNVINDQTIPISAIAIIDDEESKKGKYIANTKIITRNEIDLIQHDGILISSFTNNQIIYQRLLDCNYDQRKILQFFNN